MINKRKKGFTLIELLVVVLIIGILSAIALPQYEKAVEKSRAAEAITLMSSAQKAVDVLCLENPDFDNQIIGCPDNSSTNYKCGILDVDVENFLTCTEDGPESCHSKYFTYDAFGSCSDGEIWIESRRYNNGDKNETELYNLSLVRSSNGSWEKWSYCSDSRLNSICNSFMAQ